VLRYGLFPVVDEGFEDQRTRDAFIDGKKISASLGGGCQHEFSLGDFKLPGGHNRSNLLAVILAALCVGIDSDVIQEGIDSFKGLHHRIEFVEEIGGVSFYDDSKATNLDATIKSVESFEAPVVLIAGGRHKGADYEPLVRACVGRVKAAVFIGEAREILAEAFRGSLPYRIAEDMKDAVSLAISSAGPGDVVLLAPACSSFDMFTDYSHRGRVFRDEVRRHVNE
jgi:UDP-N-acetylmuramoylalanine--D-glutamate ligase